MSANMHLLGVDSRDVHNEMKWEIVGRCKVNPAVPRTQP